MTTRTMSGAAASALSDEEGRRYFSSVQGSVEELLSAAIHEMVSSRAAEPKKFLLDFFKRAVDSDARSGVGSGAVDTRSPAAGVAAVDGQPPGDNARGDPLPTPTPAPAPAAAPSPPALDDMGC